MNYHHGEISKVESDQRLLNTDDDGEKVGRYLVRKSVEKYLLSYVDENGRVQDILFPSSKGHSILKHNPNLRENVEDIVTFFELSNLGENFLYRVQPPSNPNVAGPKVLGNNQCHVCEIVTQNRASFEYHMKQHTVVYCKSCTNLFTYREGFPPCRYIL